ncbi:MAG TPA: hypothetical protein VF476_03205 [Chitinophagaceae bacterium]
MDTNIQLIKEKLSCIPNALLCNLSDNDEKFPNSLVEYSSIDESGKLLMKMPKPLKLYGCYEKKFPVRLLFYRKDLDYYIESSGVAEVDPDTAVASLFPVSQPEYLLLKIAPSFIQVVENNKPSSLGTRINRLLTSITPSPIINLFFKPRLKNNKQYGY